MNVEQEVTVSHRSRPGSVGRQAAEHQFQCGELIWRKSSWSNPSGNCVELAVLPDGGMALRNSRDPAAGTLTYTRAGIAAFLRGVRAAEFDLPRSG